MSSSNTETTTVDVVMPQMGVSVSEGTIVEWRKQVGDWVEYEEPIVDISTDKIDTEVPSPAAGRLAEIVVEPGTTVDVGTVLARLATNAKPGQAHASEQNGDAPAAAKASFNLVVFQLVLVDLVFSLDSIITAIGMAQDLEIMVAAVVIACVVAFGLISALLGDGIWDQASWLALAVPLAIIVFYMGKRAAGRGA